MLKSFLIPALLCSTPLLFASPDETIQQTAQAPIIDGAIEAIWGDVTRFPIAVLQEGSTSGPDDSSGYWYGMYDSDNLYFAVEIIDDYLTSSAGAQEWRSDRIEVFFNMDNAKPAGNARVGDNYQYAFNWHKPSATYGSPNANWTGVSWAQSDTDHGYLVEAAIPWSSLGINAPSVGFSFGFDIVINDTDADEDFPASFLYWSNNGDALWENMDGAGTLGLSEGGDIVETSLHGTIDGGSNPSLNLNFNIEGDFSKTVLITGYGPSLSSLDPLADPLLELFDQGLSSQSIALNDNWQSADNSALISKTGSAPSHSKESAILIVLEPGSYTATLRSNTQLNSNESRSLSIQVQTLPGFDITAPTTPDGLRVSSNSYGSIELQWNQASDDQFIAGYNLYQDNRSPVYVTDTQASFSGLAPNTLYSFKIAAVDRAGNESALSSPLLVNTGSWGANVKELNIVVDATYSGYAVPFSRDAHFKWIFESSDGGAVRIGQFACGSYWVAPAQGESGVTVVALGGNPAWTDYVSCDADPITESHGLLDGSNNYGSYNPDENIVPRLPQTFTPDSQSAISLVAAMQRNEAATGNGGTQYIVGEVVDAYNVVTILDAPPPNNGVDMIRPNITGTYKEFLTWDDFDLSRLKTYSFLNGYSAQGWKDAASRWRNSSEIFSFVTETSPGNFTAFSEGGRAFRSHILIHDYAMGTTRAFHDDFLAILSDKNSFEAKKATLAAMLSYGLDIYHTRYDSTNGLRRSWTSGAGQWAGRFLPPVILAALQKDPTKADQLKKVAILNHGEDSAELGPQELRQITRGVTGVLLWGDQTPIVRSDNSFLDADWRYWSDFKASDCYDTSIGNCQPSVGKKTSADLYGYIDGPANQPGMLYMGVTSGAMRAFAAIMVLMPSLVDVINTYDPIEYTDRLVRHGIWTYPDPVAPPSTVDQSGCNTWYNTNGCQEWGATWGPYLPDIRFAIENGVGRFHSMNGDPIDWGGYGSTQAVSNWNRIMALYDGPTFEDNVVPVGTAVAPEILFESGSNPKAHLLCPTIDAQVRYTIDGTNPTESSPLYSGPFSITNGTQVKTRAFRSDLTPSKIRSQTFSNSSVETEYWWAYPIDSNNYVNTVPLGWLKLTTTPWTWSYTLNHWLLAPDPGQAAQGTWIFVTK